MHCRQRNNSEPIVVTPFICPRKDQSALFFSAFSSEIAKVLRLCENDGVADADLSQASGVGNASRQVPSHWPFDGYGPSGTIQSLNRRHDLESTQPASGRQSSRRRLTNSRLVLLFGGRFPNFSGNGDVVIRPHQISYFDFVQTLPSLVKGEGDDIAEWAF